MGTGVLVGSISGVGTLVLVGKTLGVGTGVLVGETVGAGVGKCVGLGVGVAKYTGGFLTTNLDRILLISCSTVAAVSLQPMP